MNAHMKKKNLNFAQFQKVLSCGAHPQIPNLCEFWVIKSLCYIVKLSSSTDFIFECYNYLYQIFPLQY